jgi:hypothetical protein
MNSFNLTAVRILGHLDVLTPLMVSSNEVGIRMLNFGEMFSETHVVANTRNWSFIVKKLQRNSCGVINDAYL